MTSVILNAGKVRMVRQLLPSLVILLAAVGCGTEPEADGATSTDSSATENLREPGLNIGQDVQLIIRFDETASVPRMQELMQELAPEGQLQPYSLSFIPEEFQIQVGSLAGELDSQVIEAIEDTAKTFDEVLAVDRM